MQNIFFLCLLLTPRKLFNFNEFIINFHVHILDFIVLNTIFNVKFTFKQYQLRYSDSFLGMIPRPCGFLGEVGVV